MKLKENFKKFKLLFMYKLRHFKGSFDGNTHEREKVKVCHLMTDFLYQYARARGKLQNNH